MADQRFAYYRDVVETGRFDGLHSNLNERGRAGWRLVHVVPCPRSMGDPGDMLVVWERPLAPRGGGTDDG